MQPFQILPSTTSHKHEPIVPTLEVFARLGFRDLDLNLNHIVERGADPDEIRRAVAANNQRIWIVSGGWCDFFDRDAAAERTVASVERQVALAHTFEVDRIRLFFGRLPYDQYTPDALAASVANIQRVADRHRDLLFVFENHDGASSHPEVCRAILERVDRPNVRLTFDPINFEHRGARTMDALQIVQPLVGHVHLKGYAGGEFCGFGEGDVDLAPALQALIAGGYRGAFTVEYEGIGDRTVRLYQSVQRARSILEASCSGISHPEAAGTSSRSSPPAR
jgi:sugar phosphate isomerase/epimerase